MRRALIWPSATSAQRSGLARPHRLGPVALPVSTMTSHMSRAAVSSTNMSWKRLYATESKNINKKGKQTSKKDDSDKDLKNDEKDDHDSPFPGLEGFFGGALGKGGRNNKPGSIGSRKAGKTSFPFGFSMQDSAKNSESESSKDGKMASSNSNNQSGPGSGGGTGGGGGGTPIGPYVIPIGALLLFHYFTNFDSSSREITWQEFRTAFLDKGLVDKLVVVNRSRVRVQLHSNATGVLYPQSPAADGRSSYYFSIGSVEAFEKKLDDAQRELGIPSNERVPVAYKDETSLSSTLLSFAPTLMIVGLLYYLSRRAGAAASGGMGGGPGGIFGVGKSKAKLFNVSLPFLCMLHPKGLRYFLKFRLARDRCEGAL